MDKLKDWVQAATDSVLSLAKIIVKSKWNVTIPKVADGEELVILGNGPSLNTTLADSRDFVMQRRRLALNFAACAPVFAELQPQYYVLADPHFFVAFDQPNVQKLWNELTSVTWPMQLMLPCGAKIPSDLQSRLSANAQVSVVRYNLVPVEGFACVENFAFSHGLGMPRPRNVLIPSIMLALMAGFKTVYVAGADHSWIKTISVNDKNEVVSIQPHFYKEDDKEVTRQRTEYLHYPLHQILQSFYVAFRSYHTIQRYACHIGAKIYNITPESFIDAFERKKV